MRTLIAVGSVLLILLVLLEGFEGLVLPRRISRPLRLTRGVYVVSWKAWKAVARLLPHGVRDDALSAYGPLSLIGILSLWAWLLIAAFAVLHWSLGSVVLSPEKTPTLNTYFYLSATTFITLGFGDVAPRSNLARAISDIEAGIGFGFLAIVIGYLPVLYGAFARREIEIGLMDARASTPPTAGELLLRLAPVPDLGDITDSLRNWERWSAELLESHLSYPVLLYYRSQHDRQSWLATLAVILDTSAILIAAGEKTLAPKLLWQARLTFAMARHAAVDLRLSLTPHTPIGLPARLPDNGESLLASLTEAGVPLETDTDARRRLIELRALYEPHLYVLAGRLSLELPPIASEPTATDNWRTSTDPRGHFFSVAPLPRGERRPPRE